MLKRELAKEVAISKAEVMVTAVLKAAALLPAEPTPNCPSFGQLKCYAEQTLTPDMQLQILKHLTECRFCDGLVDKFQRLVCQRSVE